MIMIITRDAKFIAELAARLAKDVEAHEKDIEKHSLKCHAGRNIPEKKTCIQADIRRLRRELMALYRKFED